MKTSAMALLFSLTVSGALLASAAQEAASSDEAAELVVWTHATITPERRVAWEADVKGAFQEAHPHVTINLEFIPETYDTAKTAIAGGGGPDITVMYGGHAMELARAGLLYEMNDYAEQYGWDERFASWALPLWGVDGNVYTLPDEIETLVLYYSPQVFERHGWTPPDTMDDLIALAEQVEAAGVIPFGHNSADWHNTHEWFIGEFINGWAGPEKTYEALIGERSWTDPDFVESMEILASFQQNGWFSGSLDRYYAGTFTERWGNFANGDSAMLIEGTWFPSGAVDYFGPEHGNDNEWDWVPTPTRTGDAIFNVGIGEGYAVAAATRHADAAALFLDWLFSSETQGQLFAGDVGKQPAPVKVEPEHMEGADERVAGILGLMHEAFAEGNYGYTMWTFSGPKTNTYQNRGVEKLWAGDITAAQYMADWQELHAAELAEGAVPPVPPR